MVTGPVIHASGEGEQNMAFGFRRWFRVPHAAGAGFSLWEEEIEPGAGPPLHVHLKEHELFTVLSGNIHFHCDGTDAELGAGGTVLIPAGAHHSFKGLGPGMARVTVMLTPGHGEVFFRIADAEKLDPATQMDRIVEIARENDMEFVGPPL